MPAARTPAALLGSALLIAGAAAGLLGGLLGAPPAGAEMTAGMSRVSAKPPGQEVKGTSFRPTLSADGQFVAFDSESGSLVDGDTNGVRDIFVADRLANTVTRITAGVGGVQSNGDSERAWISRDGNVVAFWSRATNLVDGDTNGVEDVFVVDRAAGLTTRLSVGPDGAGGNGPSLRPAVSGDGRFVAFESAASNLVDSDTNATMDVFVRDLANQKTTRVSVGPDGAQGEGNSERAVMSGDGNLVVFHSTSTNVVAGDTNAKSDIFLYDLAAKTSALVSVGPNGEQANQASRNPSISADGRAVTFWSYASNLDPAAGDVGRTADVFVRDLATNTTTLVSVSSAGVRGDNESVDAVISGNGNLVTFWSSATNLVESDTNAVADVFVHDRAAKTTTRVSQSAVGEQGNGASLSPYVSADGRHVAFDSKAANLVAGDANNASDVFVRTY